MPLTATHRPSTGGYTFLYNFPNSQLAALQQVSTLAKQSLDFECQGVLFYYRNTGEIWSSAAQFRAFGGAFTWDYNTYRAPYPYRKLTMSAGQDGCRFNENVRRSADATFEGDPTVRFDAKRNDLLAGRA